MKGVAWDAALQLLREAMALGADARAFNGAMSACLAAGRWAVALEIQGLMTRRQVEGDKWTAGSVMKAQGQARRWHLALAELAKEVDEVNCGVGSFKRALKLGIRGVYHGLWGGVAVDLGAATARGWRGDSRVGACEEMQSRKLPWREGSDSFYEVSER